MPSFDPPISMFDHVRVRSVPVTEELGLAGLIGVVYGHTTPSVTGVSVIGQSPSDYAINVHFDEHGKEFWFAPELLDFIDHAPGTEIKIAGHKLARTEDGEWTEEK